jgi:hypothetical protein
LISAKFRDGQGRDLLDGQGQELQVNAEAIFTLTGMPNSYSFNGKLEISIPDEERRKMAGSLGRDWIAMTAIFSLSSATASFQKSQNYKKSLPHRT